MQSEAAAVSGGAASWLTLGKALNCTGESILACVRDTPASTIKGIIETQSLNFDPIKDDITCSKNVSAALTSDKSAKIPIIIGSNADDGTVFGVVFGGGDPATVKPGMGKTITASTFQCPAATVAMVAAQHEFPSVYRYYYNVSVSKYDPFQKAGAYHSGEIGLIFGTYPKERTEFQKSSELMQSYWTGFAKNPEKALVGWPKLGSSTDDVMVFGSEESKLVATSAIDSTCGAMAGALITGGL